MSAKSKTVIVELLKHADVEVNGGRPWDLQVHDERLYDRVMSYGTLGFGEAYMDGWWDAEAIDQLNYRILRHDLRSKIRVDLATIVSVARSRLVEVEQRIASLQALKTELERMVTGCAHGRVDECRVIEILADHDKCLHHRH